MTCSKCNFNYYGKCQKTLQKVTAYQPKCKNYKKRPQSK